MKLVPTKAAVLLAVLTALLAVVGSAWALEPGADGWYHTGTGTRVKTIAFVDIDVYRISHFTKKLPDGKSKRAVIDLDADKKFAWTMLREVEADKIKTALKDAFAMNNYGDGAKIAKFIGAFSGDLKEKAKVTISYNAEAKTTTVSVQGGGSATVDGADFMKAVWSIWFGKIDQPKLGDAMISKL